MPLEYLKNQIIVMEKFAYCLEKTEQKCYLNTDKGLGPTVTDLG